MVGQGVAVAVGVVGRRAPDPVPPLFVRDEGDGVGVGPEGRTGEREPAGGGLERLQAGLAPRLAVSGVVDLVENDEGLALLGAVAVEHRPHTDTGVRDGDAVVLLAEGSGAVLGIELDPHPRGRLGPLLLQMLGRRDDGHLLHDVVVQQPGREGQGERRLAGAGGGYGEEVARLLLDVPLHRPLLPGTQLVGGTPGGSSGERGREVVGVRGGAGGGGSHGLRSGCRLGASGSVRGASNGCDGRRAGGSATYDNRATLPAPGSGRRADEAGAAVDGTDVTWPRAASSSAMR